jgi:S-adenosylmethionine/arginine decarboxylase-like enzyme
MPYGKELILDLHKCNPKKFTRRALKRFLKVLCKKIAMERCQLHFWDYKDCPEEHAAAPDHLKGVSCVQFISTSNITIHALDVLQKVFLNIFSCKDFDAEIVSAFAAEYFEGEVITKKTVERV